jgi:hypothetical protein
MRRIIERVVTVVTTTTWKISWEADPDPSQPNADPVSYELPQLESLPDSAPTVIDTEEDHQPEKENSPDQS